MKILFTLIKFRNLYTVFKSFLSEISTAATVRLHLTFVSGHLCPVSDTQFQEQFTLGEINDINYMT
jgi:hypothetical protein